MDKLFYEWNFPLAENDPSYAAEVCLICWLGEHILLLCPPLLDTNIHPSSAREMYWLLYIENAEFCYSLACGGLLQQFLGCVRMNFKNKLSWWFSRYVYQRV